MIYYVLYLVFSGENVNFYFGEVHSPHMVSFEAISWSLAVLLGQRCHTKVI
jgi:hypothetical protein